MVDRTGTLRFAPNLPAAAGGDIGRLVSARLGHPTVLVENDANCAAVAELALRRPGRGVATG